MTAGPRALTLADRVAITDLITRAAFAADAYLVDGFADVFTDSGVLVRPTATHVGREQIKAHAERRRRERDRERHGNTQHRLANILLEATPAGARALSYAVKLCAGCADGPPELLLAGWYSDTLLRVRGRWLIERREWLTTLPDPLSIAPQASALNSSARPRDNRRRPAARRR